MKKIVKIKSSLLLLFFTTLSCVGSSKGIKEYENDGSYNLVNIDVNNDGILDKVFYSKPYEGNELIFFINYDNIYKKELSSINFSEDGGRIVKDIVKSEDKENVVVVKTYFPDRGVYNTDFYIAYKSNDWFVTKSRVERIDWQDDPDKTIICDIKQSVLLSDLTNPEKVSNLNNLETINSSKECYNLYLFKGSLDQFALEISNRNKTALIDSNRYRQLLETDPLDKSNVTKYNNIAYFLGQRKIYKESTFLLSKIIKKYPSRTVAYINLGDAYWGLKEADKAKNAYQKYIELMKASGKEYKIPQKVFERIK